MSDDDNTPQLSRSQADWAEFEGVLERFNAMFDGVDARALEVLAAHFALEREIDITLGHFLARPTELGSLKFGHKVQVLKACCPDKYVNRFAKGLLRFDALRNALAHNDRSQIGGCFRGLINSFDQHDNARIDDTPAGIRNAARVLLEGLTFIRVENFAYRELRGPNVGT